MEFIEACRDLFSMATALLKLKPNQTVLALLKIELEPDETLSQNKLERWS